MTVEYNNKIHIKLFTAQTNTHRILLDSKLEWMQRWINEKIILNFLLRTDQEIEVNYETLTANANAIISSWIEIMYWLMNSKGFLVPFHKDNWQF